MPSTSFFRFTGMFRWKNPSYYFVLNVFGKFQRNSDSPLEAELPERRTRNKIELLASSTFSIFY